MAGQAFSSNQGKNCPTIQTATYDENVQIATALLLCSVGKMSLMIIHVIDPGERYCCEEFLSLHQIKIY